MRRWYEERVLPRLVDVVLGGAEVEALRAETCAGLSGRVLELGYGSGLNAPHYPEQVTGVAAVEPSDLAWEMARPRIDASRVPVTRSGLDGQRLEVEPGSVDSVLCTFVLCTIPDEVAALREAHRVLRPGGTVHFLEHGLAEDTSVRRWQRRLEPLQRTFGGGCHLTRRPDEALRRAGFGEVSAETSYLPGPWVQRPMTYVYRGTATKAA